MYLGEEIDGESFLYLNAQLRLALNCCMNWVYEWDQQLNYKK